MFACGFGDRSSHASDQHDGDYGEELALHFNLPVARPHESNLTEHQNKQSATGNNSVPTVGAWSAVHFDVSDAVGYTRSRAEHAA
jgi:hypothetical protein